MDAENNAHIPGTVLEEFAAGTGKLSDDHIQHIGDCQDCITALGTYRANRFIRPIDTDSNEDPSL